MNQRNSFKYILFLCILMIFLHASITHAYANRVTQGTCGSWSIVKSPDVGTGHNYLEAVAAVSPGDIWAVGSVYGHFPHAETLIEHWNGTDWQIVPGPGITSNIAAFLTGVTALSDNDVWAVGHYLNSDGVSQTLIEHWNGTKWQTVSSPNFGHGGNSLDGIAAASASDIWAVGSVDNGTLTEHWDGALWSIVSSPNAGHDGDSLESIAVVSGNDVWASGTYGASMTDHSLIEHWNGRHWTIVSSPSPGTFVNDLLGIAAVSANDVWAVGSDDKTLIEHWNGGSWKVVSSPNAHSGGGLAKVTAVSANNIWAVGSSQINNGPTRTLIEQWNGTKWQLISSPDIGSLSNDLLGVVALSTHDIWSVGDYENRDGLYQTLIAHYC